MATLEDLVDFDSSQWDKLTEEEMHAIFKESLTVTRPEMAAKPRGQNNSMSAPVINMTPNKAAALKALQLEGLDLSFMSKRKKR